MTKLITVTCSVLLVLFSSLAYSADKNYGRFSMGLTVPANAYLKDPLTAPGEMVKTKYKAGVSAAVAMGHEFEKFRIEGETIYQKNEFDIASFSGTEITLDGEISILSFLINGYFDYKTRSNFTPYAGGGLGISRIQVKDLSIPISEGVDISCSMDEDYIFTYQLGVGVGYAVMDDVSIDLNYRYLVPSDPDYDTTKAEFSSHNVYLGLRIYF